MDEFLQNLFNKLQDHWERLISGGYGEHTPVILAFAVPAFVFWMIARQFNRRPKSFVQHLDEVEDNFDAAQNASPEPAGGLFRAIAPSLAAQIPESQKEGQDFRKLLRGAGMYAPGDGAIIYAMRFVFLFAPIVAAGVMILMSDKSATIPIAIGGVLVAVALSILPRLYVYFRRRSRVQKIRNGLPDTMDMLSMCIGGGMAISPSLDHVARQLTSYPELAQELLILKRQSEVGSLRMALADFASRVDLPEVRQLTGLLTRGERLGTKLAGSLAEHSDHLRATRKQMATLQANKTPVKLVLPLIFCFAPAALILLIAPALVELKEFISPTHGDSVISGKRILATDQIEGTLKSLDLSVSDASSPSTTDYRNERRRSR